MIAYVSTMRLLPRLVTFAVAMGASAATAATLTATPETLETVLSRARGGDTVVLAQGHYRGLRIVGRAYQPALTIDASAAELTGVELRSVKGISFQGGRFLLPPPVKHPRDGRLVFGQTVRIDASQDTKIVGAELVGPGVLEANGPFGEGYGLLAVRSSGVAVSGSRFRGLKSGIVLSKVDGFDLRSNQFRAMRSDGIQIGEGRRGRIEDNDCAQTRIRDVEHPDCIQLWSRPTSPPTADVVIRGNRATGGMQGVFLGNHVRDGVDDGGFDRITIEDNVLEVGYPNGIAISDGRGSVVRNNKVTTFPGARWRASINLRGGDSVRCGNSVKAAAGRPGIQDEACK